VIDFGDAPWQVRVQFEEEQDMEQDPMQVT
jgi:hypothetical protein